MRQPRPNRNSTRNSEYQSRALARRSASSAVASAAPAERASLVALFALATALALAVLSAALAVPAGATTTELEADAYAYGFVSRVEGEALLLGADVDEAIEAEINHPLLTGDQINTRSGRIELVLPDGTVVRAAPGTVVVFDTLAGAPDAVAEEGTYLSLDQGELQIRTPESFVLGDDLAVQTANATLYLGAAGSYRILAQGSSFTELVVRSGFAEASTPSGSEIARDGEALEITGEARPFVNLVEAGPADSLELWAGDLDRLAEDARQSDVDPRLAYAAAPLEGNGEWVESPNGRAWRPYVRPDWRPFRYGRWVYTPSGLTWVASAPWGWVTSHYGSWDYVPGYGWLWLPGNVYFPAGVYWYWGPTHVAWIPHGYYNRYSRGGYGFGVYGWAGGDWGYWADWTFCPTRYFGRRGYDRYWESGRSLERERRFAVPRGIVTTDTRGLGPDSWGKPSEALDRLIRRSDARDLGRSLPDVTDFVARRKAVDVVGGSSGTRVLGGNKTSRSRLAPLADDRARDRFRSQTGSQASNSAGDDRVRSTAGIRRGDDSGGTRTGSGGRLGTGRAPSRAGDASDLAGSRRGTVREIKPGTRGGTEPPSSRVRSVGDRRAEPSSRSIREGRVPKRETGSALGGSGSVRESTGASTSAPPARRVLDRIRAHRESARGRSSGSSASSAPKSGSRSSAVSKGSSTSSSRGSGSSTRGSGSNRGSVKKSSPPPRSSKGNSSRGGSSRSRSRDNN